MSHYFCVHFLVSVQLGYNPLSLERVSARLKIKIGPSEAIN